VEREEEEGKPLKSRQQADLEGVRVEEQDGRGGQR